MSEFFIDIKSYEGHYKISNMGNILSLKNNTSKIIKPIIDAYGYYFVNLSKNGIVQVLKVHQLMAINFLNHKPGGYKIIVDHINNNSLDNRLENLQVITQRKNASKDKKGTSKFTGVYWDKSRNKWKASIWIDDRRVSLGRFDN